MKFEVKQHSVKSDENNIYHQQKNAQKTKHLQQNKNRTSSKLQHDSKIIQNMTVLDG